MNKTGNQLFVRIPDPFDDMTRTRLIHMGLVDETGRLNTAAMSVLTDIFTGLFYDDMRDFLKNTEDVLTIFETFKALYKKEDYQRMYLLLSIQYDYMGKPLPDPIWWFAGDGTVVKTFMSLFMERYERLMSSDGIIERGEGEM